MPITAGRSLEWVEPGEWLPAANMRKTLDAALTATVTRQVWSVWQSELPAEVETAVARKIGKSIRKGTKSLTQVPSKIPDPYWPDPWWVEPPESLAEPDLPKHQLQTYRLTASFLAQQIRNSLEEFHAGYQTSNARMPLLNRGLRNQIYQTLLTDPVAAWRLSTVFRCLFDAAAAGRIPWPPYMALAG